MKLTLCFLSSVLGTPTNFCSLKSNGVYGHPRVCEKFISCSNNMIYEMDCPANLQFNRDTKNCDWPRNVKCGIFVTPDQTTIPTSNSTDVPETPATPITSDVEIACEGSTHGQEISMTCSDDQVIKVGFGPRNS